MRPIAVAGPARRSSRATGKGRDGGSRTGARGLGCGCSGAGGRPTSWSRCSRLLDPDLEEAILLVNSPSATAIVPLLSKVKGVVCADGGMTSHLAIVSREFGLPCVMAADVHSLGDLDGRRLTVSAEGEIDVG